jgi:hypothetical protein
MPKHKIHKYITFEWLRPAFAFVLCVAIAGNPLAAWAQNQQAQNQQGQSQQGQSQQDQQGQSSSQSSPQTQDNGKPKQDVPADAGGPTDSVGPYATPTNPVKDR